MAMAHVTLMWRRRLANAAATRHTWERHAAIVAPWIHTQTLPAVVLTVEPVCVMMKRCPMVLAVSARSHLLARPATLHAQCSRARSAEATVNASSRPLARFLLAFASAMSALLDPTVRATAHATCGFTKDHRAQCTCDEGWATNNCEHRICRTPNGVFNKETEECTCSAGEVCCEK